MAFSRSLAVATAVSIVSPLAYAFNAESKSNIAVYYGQGYDQPRLSHFCQDSSLDIINIGFINEFPDQSAANWPGSNFGNQCDGLTYEIGGVKTKLLSGCHQIMEDIPICQAAGKKILLSLGGASPENQQILSKESAIGFAEFLWASFGPVDEEWVAWGGPRPFGNVSVDGFDFDIEHNGGFGYGTMVTRFRELFAGKPDQRFYLSGSPQCHLPDKQLSSAIATSAFDFLWVQFYNNEDCSARNFVNGEGFNFDDWVDVIKSGGNPAAKLFVGLPGSKAAALDGYYLTPEEVKSLASKYMDLYPDTFGGIMVWEATQSERNQINGTSYAGNMKRILAELEPSPPAPTISPSSSPIASSTPIRSSTPALSPSGAPAQSSTPVASLTPLASSTPVRSSLPVQPSPPALSSIPVVPNPSRTPVVLNPSSTPVRSSSPVQPSQPARSSTPVVLNPSSTPVHSSSLIQSSTSVKCSATVQPSPPALSSTPIHSSSVIHSNTPVVSKPSSTPIHSSSLIQSSTSVKCSAAVQSSPTALSGTSIVSTPSSTPIHSSSVIHSNTPVQHSTSVQSRAPSASSTTTQSSIPIGSETTPMPNGHGQSSTLTLSLTPSVSGTAIHWSLPGISKTSCTSGTPTRSSSAVASGTPSGSVIVTETVSPIPSETPIYSGTPVSSGELVSSDASTPSGLPTTSGEPSASSSATVSQGHSSTKPAVSGTSYSAGISASANVSGPSDASTSGSSGTSTTVINQTGQPNPVESHISHSATTPPAQTTNVATSTGREPDNGSGNVMITSTIATPSVMPTSSTSEPLTVTTVIVTSYIDICPTGFTTITTTYTTTYCPGTVSATATATNIPSGSGAQTAIPTLPEGWTSTVTVCTHCAPTPTTVTLTLPVTTTTMEPPTAPPAEGWTTRATVCTECTSTPTTVVPTLPVTTATMEPPTVPGLQMTTGSPAEGWTTTATVCTDCASTPTTVIPTLPVTTAAMEPPTVPGLQMTTGSPAEGWTTTVSVCTDCASTPTTFTLTVPVTKAGSEPVNPTSTFHTGQTSNQFGHENSTNLVVTNTATSHSQSFTSSSSGDIETVSVRPSSSTLAARPWASGSRVPVAPSETQDNTSPLFTGAASHAVGLGHGASLLVGLALPIFLLM